MCGGGKRRNSFFATDPRPYPNTGPQAKAGSLIKGGEKNFVLKSLGSLFSKIGEEPVETTE
jgi:hypothetical protein